MMYLQYACAYVVLIAPFAPLIDLSLQPITYADERRNRAG